MDFADAIFANTSENNAGPSLSTPLHRNNRSRVADGGFLRVEVKYCEGCGALRLRFAGSNQIYCDTCQGSIGTAALSRRARRQQ